MNVRLWRRGNLARRYLFAALVAALIPLVLMAALYDHYSAQLIETISRSRTEGELEAVAARMNSFLAGQMNRLENIADLPDTAAFLRAPGPITEQFFDFLLLEAESPDVYGIELRNVEGELVTAVPQVSRAMTGVQTTTPFVRHDTGEVIGPVLPQSGLPGWFLIRMPVLVNHETLGFVVMRMRLASLSEQMAPLVHPHIQVPHLVVFDRIRVGATGVSVAGGEVVQTSRPILPGWRVELIAQTQRLTDPLQKLRTTLLVLSAALAVVLSILFLQLSNRLSNYLQPLKVGADAVSRGDFSTPVPETGPGELGSLARAFNDMRRHLRDMINSRVDMERRAALGNMAAGIAHEVRNPLATVSTTLYGLKTGERDPERIEMYAEISDEIERVDRTIGEFLKYARPALPNVERVAVRDVFRSLRTLTAARLMDRDITLNLGGDSRLEFDIDPAHLRQILLNLVLNAIDALPEGGLISLTVFRQGTDIVLGVTDDGVGMDLATLDRACARFSPHAQGEPGWGWRSPPN